MPNNIPTEPGYYWHRDIDEGDRTAYEWEVLSVERNFSSGGLRVSGHINLACPEEVTGEWGPRIPDPEEKQEQEEEVAAMRALLAESEISLRPIRDNFAAFALAGLLANGVPIAGNDLGEVAYRAADAMIAERDKRNA